MSASAPGLSTVKFQSATTCSLAASRPPWSSSDAVVRLIPNVLGNFSSALDDSFQEAVLDCPWYTRPVEFRGQRVPAALLSGDHERIEHWRRLQALRRTFARRPDLLQQIELDEEEQQLIAIWQEARAGRSPVTDKVIQWTQAFYAN